MSEEKIKAYKAFNKDMKCRDFQYEVGKEYSMDGDISVCNRGFHACECPMDVWNYYDMTTSRFAVVEQSGKIDRNGDDTKVCSSKIKIKAELKLADIINLGVEWVKNITSPSSVKINRKLNDSGRDYAQIGSSGYYAQIGSSGNYAQIGSSGYYAQIGSSGDNAQIGSSGDNAQIGSSGYYAQIGSSGYYAQIGSSGNFAKIKSEGQDAVVMCAGYDSVASAKLGSWITLAEWKCDHDKGRLVPVCVKTEQVDGKRIKEDTFYKLEDGEFVEVEP